MKNKKTLIIFGYAALFSGIITMFIADWKIGFAMICVWIFTPDNN